MKLFFLLIFFPTLIYAITAPPVIDGVTLKEREVIDTVVLHNALKDDTRIIHAWEKASYNAPAETVFKLVQMFNKKCNNKYKSKRKYTDKKVDCPFHNENLIESVIIKNINKNYTPEKNEFERYIIKRRVYNTGNYSHNDLVILKKFKNKKNEQVYEAIHKLIDDKEAKKYIKDPIEHDSVFSEMIGTYHVVEKAPNKTDLIYTYVSKTDHWMLKKDIVVGRLYRNTAKGTILALKAVQTGLDLKLIPESKKVEVKQAKK